MYRNECMRVFFAFINRSFFVFLSSWSFDYELPKIKIKIKIKIKTKTVNLIFQPSIAVLRSVGQVDSLF